MKREFNTPDEMLKRLIYVVYLACLFFGFGFAIMGILGGQLFAALLSVVFLPAAVALKIYGGRHLEFKRLAESFPLGSLGDSISKETRSRFETLVTAFHTADDWTERQAIRLEMTEMVQVQPLLRHVFDREIAEIHPRLFSNTRDSVDS
ncbi:MAG: hypothetical protein JXR76_11695 [Deltaproteobacteria bacterium]|nr:hypothetical protein [Deltaproteobacteria bacterium]